ncbi:MAG: TRAP transporter small permease [Proteobacteria bacterium]|nr:TRAP transporter small permease [Pseudomonadota bacterium]
MKPLLTVIEKIENGGAFLAALTLALMFLLGMAEIIMRSFFAASIPVSLEYSGYLVAFSFLMGAGWTLREGKQVRVSLINFPAKYQRSLELLVTGIALMIALLLAYGLVSWAFGSWMRGSVSYFPSATPLWIPQAILALGPVVLALSLIGRLIRLATGEEGS